MERPRTSIANRFYTKKTSMENYKKIEDSTIQDKVRLDMEAVRKSLPAQTGDINEEWGNFNNKKKDAQKTDVA